MNNHLKEHPSAHVSAEPFPPPRPGPSGRPARSLGAAICARLRLPTTPKAIPTAPERAMVERIFNFHRPALTPPSSHPITNFRV